MYIPVRCSRPLIVWSTCGSTCRRSRSRSVVTSRRHNWPSATTRTTAVCCCAATVSRKTSAGCSPSARTASDPSSRRAPSTSTYRTGIVARTFRRERSDCRNCGTFFSAWWVRRRCRGGSWLGGSVVSVTASLKVRRGFVFVRKMDVLCCVCCEIFMCVLFIANEKCWWQS